LKYLKIPIVLLRIFWGYLIFIFTGKTRDETYSELRRIYFLTNRHFNLIFAKSYNAIFSRYKIKNHSDSAFFPVSQTQKFENHLESLKSEGYTILSDRISPDTCEKLFSYLISQKGNRRTNPEISEYISREKPLDYIYDFDHETILSHEAFHKIVFDPFLLQIVQRYLGPAATLHCVSAWWSTAQAANQDLSHAAQMFHIDLDIVKWVNIFVYLNDVDETNGPHVYVRRTHQNKPSPIFLDRRITDEEILQFYEKKDVIKLMGAKGTTLIVDTEGYHKGEPLITGERLVLQIRFAISRFGKTYPQLNFDKKYCNLDISQFPYNRIYGDFFDSGLK
jgi:hypothetical protein